MQLITSEITNIFYNASLCIGLQLSGAK